MRNERDEDLERIARPVRGWCVREWGAPDTSALNLSDVMIHRLASAIKRPSVASVNASTEIPKL